MLFFTCIVIDPIRSGEKFPFSEEVREKHMGFSEIGQGKFVLLKQKSGKFFSESLYKPCSDPNRGKMKNIQITHRIGE